MKLATIEKGIEAFGNGDFVLTKTFLSGPVLRGGTVELEFTLTNVSAASALTAIAFTDSLPAGLRPLLEADAVDVEADKA